MISHDVSSHFTLIPSHFAGTNMWMAGGENRQSAVQQDDDEPVSPVAERRLLSVNAPSSPTVTTAVIMNECITNAIFIIF